MLLIQKVEKLKKKFSDHAKYITTAQFKKFSGKIFCAKLKQAKLATNKDLTDVEQRAIENKRKIEKLETEN